MSTVIGYEELKAELDRITTNCTNGAWLNEACEYVKNDAKARAPVDIGSLRESIDHKITGRGRENLEGIIFTDAPHSQYVEFGTGPIGAANHGGISPKVAVAYNATPWYLHESQVIPNKGGKGVGKWEVVHGKGGEKFYRVYGQAAQPFLYPALAQNIDTVIDIAERGIDDALDLK